MVAAVQPPGPAWYLQAVGVHADEQGAGVGSLLLTHGLARIDRGQTAARLETATLDAARLYERFGLRRIREAQLVTGGPARVLMQRPAGVPASIMASRTAKNPDAGQHRLHTPSQREARP